MDRAKCPSCDYRVGLGAVSEPGRCPSCGLALMLTSEFRALSREEILAEARRRSSTESTRS
jgi:predicted Zn-ribbon and HTH transcriptional regulator